MFTGREVPVVISAKTEFPGHLDTVIGEHMCSLVFICVRIFLFDRVSVVLLALAVCDSLYTGKHATLSQHALCNFHHLILLVLLRRFLRNLLCVKSPGCESERVNKLVGE